MAIPTGQNPFTIIAKVVAQAFFSGWVYQSFNLCYTTYVASTIIRWVRITTLAGTSIYTLIRIYTCCQHYITLFLISSTGYTQISSKLVDHLQVYHYLVTQWPNHSSCVTHCVFLVTYITNITYWICDPFTSDFPCACARGRSCRCSCNRREHKNRHNIYYYLEI